MIDSTTFDLLAFLIGCVVGIFVGWKINDRFHTTLTTDLFKAVGVSDVQLRQAIDRLQADVAQDTEPALPGVEVRVECVDNQLYVYRLDNMEFLCQGATRDDIIESLATRFHKDFKIIVTEEHGAQYLKPNPTS
jgi:beta-phosphoglucomutase-like phosphatase (HAD superfamily)